MSLLILFLVLLQLALALALAWTHWSMRRRLDELQRRVDESLDDQDLVEFESRVRALLAQVKDSGGAMIEAVAKREEALLRGLEKVKDAEARLQARAKSLEAAADKAGRRLEQAPPSSKRQAPKSKTPPPDPGLPEPIAKSDSITLGDPEKPQETKPTYSPRPFQPIAATPGPAKHQKIYDLADQGRTKAQICLETGLLPGEVDLILNLRPAQRRAK